MKNFNNGNSFQGIAWKVIMILTNLFLQKPSQKSKSKEHANLLEERLKMWKHGNITSLLKDCKMIQAKLTAGKRRKPQDIDPIFTKLVFEGKISAAMKFLDEVSK